MGERYFRAYVPEGHDLGKSRDEPGASRGLVYDGNGNLAGHLNLEEIDAPDDGDDDYDYDYDQSGAESGEINLLGVLGVIAVAAGVGYAANRATKHIRARRAERAAESTAGPTGKVAGSTWGRAATPPPREVSALRDDPRSAPRPSTAAVRPGWYVDPSDQSRLRFWNGLAWTDSFAPRHRPAPRSVPGWNAGWYVDASDASRLRYWDGAAWTGHISPRPFPPSAPMPKVGWYTDPTDGTRLRYWSGAAWTEHVAFRSGAPARSSSPEVGLAAAHASRSEVPTVMTSVEWQRLVVTWLSAGALSDELWRRISSARIADPDAETLESQRVLSLLTADQGRDRIRATLEASGSSHDGPVLAGLIAYLAVHGQAAQPRTGLTGL